MRLPTGNTHWNSKPLGWTEHGSFRSLRTNPGDWCGNQMQRIAVFVQPKVIQSNFDCLQAKQRLP